MKMDSSLPCPPGPSAGDPPPPLLNLPCAATVNLLRSQDPVATEAMKVRGSAMHDLIRRLYPLCRSITGHGTRETLRILGEMIPLQVHEVPSGTRVFDWIVPDEWNIRDAYIKDPEGRRIVDFNACNLHVVGYSRPVHQKMTAEELRPHLFSLPEHPAWVPYRTSFYRDSWGFCVSHERWNLLMARADEHYEVCIDASKRPGSMTYAECFLPGRIEDEALISCHICHPSLCNDNLSGIAVAVELARTLARSSTHYSYRFVFIPATIGSIAWLSRNEDRVRRIRHGLVLTCLGDQGQVQYKRSRQGDASIDRAALEVLKHHGRGYGILKFEPYGYDERQYCSPAFDLPMGVLMRSRHGTFPEYHTSADDLSFVKPESLADSYAVALSILELLERDDVYVNRFPKGEPQLGKRGLFSRPTPWLSEESLEMAMLWVLNLSDGKHRLLDIAERSGMDFFQLAEAVNRLVQADCLQRAGMDGD